MKLHSARSQSARVAPPEAERDEWWRHARCAWSADRDAWTADDLHVRLAAAHQCIAHCPVLARCHAEARDQPQRGVAVGGLVYGYDGLPLDMEPPRYCARCRPLPPVTHPCQRLALCERCGREFVADHPMRRQCRTEECERARWRESRRLGRLSTGVIHKDPTL